MNIQIYQCNDGRTGYDITQNIKKMSGKKIRKKSEETILKIVWQPW